MSGDGTQGHDWTAGYDVDPDGRIVMVFGLLDGDGAGPTTRVGLDDAIRNAHATADRAITLRTLEDIAFAMRPDDAGRCELVRGLLSQLPDWTMRQASR